MNVVPKSWLRAVRNLFPRQRRPLARRTRPRLFLEHLETRLTPSNAIVTLAGTGAAGYSGDNGPATAAMLYTPSGTAVDSSGNLFIADTYNNRIREVVKATGNIVTVAGTGSSFYNGDNLPATSASIGYPHGIAVDASGNLFIADTNNNRIREVVRATGNIITVAGTGAAGFSGDNGPATAAMLNSPWGVALDGNGNIYFTDQGNNRVREVKTNGVIVTVAGTGTAGYGGDNGPATAAQLNQPSAIAADAQGDVFIADARNNRVREVQANGVIVTVAGTGSVGYNGDGEPATAANLNYPNGVVVDPTGNLYIGDSNNERVREVLKSTGAVMTVAGNGSAYFNGDGGPATSASLYYPNGLALDANGNLYIADAYNYRVREVLSGNTPYLGAPSVTAWTVNQPGFSSTLSILGGTAPYSGLSATGLPPGLTASLNGSAILLAGTPTSAGTYSVALGVGDANGMRTGRTFSFTVNAAPSLGALTPAQGTARVSYPGAVPVTGGTGPFIITASANLPPGLNATVSGASVAFTGIPTTTGVYNNIQVTVRDAAGASASGVFSLTINAPAPGSILTVAGTGAYGSSGDGGPANLATLYLPRATAVDAAGNVYIADTYNNKIREIVKATGNIITVAGTGVSGFSGDGGVATAARLYYPTGVAVDAAGNLFIDDWYNNRIREVVKATGNIITVAGNGTTTTSGDGGPATSAGLANPWALAVDANDNVYIADRSSNLIREVIQATGIIVTVAGNGTGGYSGDGGPATSAALSGPDGVAVDAAGNLFIADTNNNRVREVVQATGNIITVAGTGVAGYGGDNGPASAARLNSPQSVAVDANGNLFICDTYNYRVREVVQATGSIVTVAGSGSYGYSGDGGPATAANMGSTYGVAVDSSGDLFFADYSNNNVREVLASSSPVLGALTNTTWTANQPGFSAASAITGGVGPYSGLTVSGLPAGLTASLSGSTVTLSGTPTAAGVYGNIVIGINDANNNSGSRTFSITVNAAPALGALTASQWTVGRSGYPGVIPLSGGTGSFTLVAQSNLPPGLTAVLSGNRVAFTGTPTAAGTFGSASVTVQDATGATATGTFSITVNPAPALGAPASSAWTANQPGFSSSIPVSGGSGPFGGLSVTGLPAGLTASLSGSTVTLSGTPTAPGTFNNVAVTVQDAAGATATGTFSITVSPAPTLGVLSLAQWTAGVAGYTGAIPVSGGTGPFTVVAQSNLPAGLSATVTGTNVTFTGVPTSAGTFANIHLTVQDATGAAVSGTFALTVNNAGLILTGFAGTGTAGYAGDNGPAAAAQLSAPAGVAIDGSGNLFIADAANNVVREVVKATGAIVTVAGTGTAGYSGDNGPAAAAQLSAPKGVAVDGSGNLFIADAGNNVIREVVQATGAIVTVAGTGTAGYSGDSGPATAALLNQPSGVAVDGSGNLFIADTGNNVVREVVGASGAITTVAGTGTAGYGGDGGPATAALLNQPAGVAVDGSGDLFIADAGNNRVREVVGTTGVITSVAGTGAAGYAGDNGPAAAALLNQPAGVAVDGSGDLFIADAGNNRVREALSVSVPSLGALSATAWTVNQAGLSAAIPVSGGLAPFGNLSVTGLPAGVTASLSGNTITLSGTPTSTGTFRLNVAVNDTTGAVASADFTFTINPAPGLGALTAAQWTVGQAGYSGAIPVSGGTGPFTVVAQSNLPPGLTAVLSGNRVVFTGTPTAAGTFASASVTAQDATGATATGTFGITVNPAPALGAPSSSAWTANQPGFSSSIPVSGGTGPFGGLSVTGLPAGLTASLSGSTVTLSGTPTAPGTFNNVAVTVQDAAGATATGTFAFTINAAPALGALTAAQWTVGQTGYPGAIAISGGTGSFTLVAQSNLPPGLTAVLSGNSIVFTGTPSTAGTYGNVQLTARDAAGVASTGMFGITVNLAPTLGELAAPGWTVNQPGYSTTIPVYGGTGPVGGLTATGLPPGLTASLSGTTITLSGTPTATGYYYPVTLGVVDAAGARVSSSYALTINAPMTMGTLTANQWTVGQTGFTGTITVSGGTLPWGIASATNLPPGLGVGLRGGVASPLTVFFTGAPTTAGTYGNVGITVQDTAGTTVSGTYSITINPAPTLGALSPTVWTVNQPGYSGAITLSGGTGPFGNLTATGLPAGLTASLSGNTITLSGTPTAAGSANVHVSVVDAAGATVGASYSLTINSVLTVGALTTNQWTVNQPGFNGVIPVSGGAGALTVQAQSNLPPGLTAAISGSNIAFTGTPTSTGVYHGVQVTVRDAVGDTATAVFDLVVNLAPTLGSPPPANWTANLPYYASIPVYYGTSPLASLIATGLPPGLSAALSGNSIVVSGTPTVSNYFGNITLGAVDAAGARVTQTDSIFVFPPLTIGSLSVSQWAVNQPSYPGTIPFSGGVSPWAITSATNLPPGMGVILTGGTSYPAVSFTGTPTTLGTYNVQVTLQDAVGATVSGTYALTITQTIPNIITVAGNGGQGYNGDNIAATSSSLNSPWGVAVDGSGNVFFADTSNNRVREIVKATGNVVTVAGNGTAGFTGDGGQASAAELNLPYGVTLDGNGNLFIGDYGGHIRKVVLATGIITTVAGNGTYSFSGDGGPATSAGLFDPFGVAVDSSGNLYIADYANERIREVSAATGIITTIAGNGTQGYSGDGGPATSAELSGPLGLAVDPSGNVFIADTYNNRIREVVKATGNIITVAGTGVGGYNGDGPAASTEIYGPGMLALDGSGNLFFADNQNQRIRELVKATGQIVTVAGVGGISGFSGDNGPALAAKLAFPKGVALDANGNLYFADQNNGRIREVLSGILGSLSSTAWTVNQPGFSGTIPIVNTAPPPGSVVSATGLPAGLSASLSGSTITITGTPTAPGTYGNVTISLLDVSGSTIASCTYTMTINAAPALGTLGGPTQWTVGQAGYAGTIPTGGGTGALTVSSQANMPPGLSAVVTGSLVTFTGTPTTVGTYSNIQLTVQDTTGATSTGTYSITINPAAASALTITGLPLTVTRGAAQTFTVSSKDPYGNTATGYSGTLHFSSSDPQAVLPPDTTLNGGTGTFQVVFASLGTESLSVTDTSNSALTATQGGITVNPAPAVRLAVTGFPSSSTAGVAATFSVAAIDAYGYVATGYTGTVHFTSSDPQAVLPADVSLTNGTGSFSATLKTAGTQSLTATDTANASLNGTEGSITVAPAAATTLSLAGFPTSITAGVSGTATVTARDAYGNVATGYTGTVHVSSSDSRASLPADYTFTMADAGVHTFAVILKTAGPQTVTFQDAQHGFTATAGISVTAAAASQFVLSGFPSATTAGLVQNLTLTALDAYGNIATGYTGAVHFTSSDHQAVLPADYSFSSSDNGVHTFSASLCTAGTQSLTATDTATATLTASQTGISVVAGTVSKFIVGGYPATTAGTSHSFTVTATDAYGNVVIGYRGTVHFTSSDVQAGLPANYTFTATDNGVHTFSATLKTAGTQSLTVTDTATPSITGSQAGISVTAAAATHLAITAPANVSIGVAFSVTVTALDAYGNIATGYLGTIHFTSSDNKAILPNNYTFVAGDAGVHTFTVTFKSSGTQTLTATDTHTGSIKGSASVKVS